MSDNIVSTFRNLLSLNKFVRMHDALFPPSLFIPLILLVFLSFTSNIRLQSDKLWSYTRTTKANFDCSAFYTTNSVWIKQKYHSNSISFIFVAVAGFWAARLGQGNPTFRMT